MSDANPEQLIYDWNARNRRGPLSPLRDRKLTFFDETLRDGIQSPSVRDPDIEQKMQILRLTASLGIDAVDLGLPGAGPRAVADVTALIEFAEQEKLGIEYACAARTHPADINAVADIADKTGQSITVYAFLGSSPIRLYAESWDVNLLIERTIMAADLCRERGLPMTFVTEDTTRTPPRILDTLFRAAVDHGVTRLCLCDTVGHAVPDGVSDLISFTRLLLETIGHTEVGDRLARAQRPRAGRAQQPASHSGGGRPDPWHRAGDRRARGQCRAGSDADEPQADRRARQRSGQFGALVRDGGQGLRRADPQPVPAGGETTPSVPPPGCTPRP